MATGHIQPGYGDTISKLRRARSAGFPLDKETMKRIAQQSVLPRGELDQIRNTGSTLWSYPQNTETSYDSHYCSRPADERMFLRPSSPNRRNRPLPAQVFLVSRLHHIPGYHNPDTTIGREAYRVDASLPSDIREHRLAARQKYIGRQSGAWVSSYRDPMSLKEQLGGRSGQAAEAWLKIADEKDHEKMFNAIHEDEENERKQMDTQNPRSKTAYPSLTRWMRFAGAREADLLTDVARSQEAQRDEDYKTPITPNPFHGRPALSSISSMRSRADLPSHSLHVRFWTKKPRSDGRSLVFERFFFSILVVSLVCQKSNDK